MQDRHQAREQTGRNSKDRADAQQSVERIPRLPGDAPHAPELLEDVPRLRDDALARRCNSDLDLAAFEQEHAELVIGLFHRDAQGRLRERAAG